MERKYSPSVLVDNVLRAYRAMQPLSKLASLIKKHESFWTSLDGQEALHSQVVNNPACVEFPPAPYYTRRFLRKIVDLLEGKREEVYEPLMERYMSLLADPHSAGPGASLDTVGTDCLFYRSYSLLPEYTTGMSAEERAPGSGMHVTLQVTDQQQSLGMTTWEAGFFLAEYVLAHFDEFIGKRIVELGCGIGLSGVVYAKAKQEFSPDTRESEGVLRLVPARSGKLDLATDRQDAGAIILTDYSADILENTLKNLRINGVEALSFPDLASAGRTEGSGVLVATCDWESFAVDSDVADFDVIVAADVVYDETLLPFLIMVLASLLNAHNLAIVVSRLRNDKTKESFRARLAAAGLSYLDLTAGG